MTDTTRGLPSLPGYPPPRFTRALTRPGLAILLLAAFVLASLGADVARANTRLASLQIEIWPEYDRRAAALVILRGELAADVALPAPVRLRIPATSGGPTALAYAGEGGKLLNLRYQRSDAAAFITLSFELPGRRFQVEFYDPLATGGRRSYAYTWPGDLAGDRLAVIVQEPVAASEITVQPAASATTLGQDGIRYRSIELGPFEAGKPLHVALSYAKADERPSVEILATSAPAAPPAAMPSAPAAVGGANGGVFVVAGAMGLLAAFALAAWWYLRRSTGSASAGDDTPACGKCGARPSSGDRFCAKCGAPLGGLGKA